MFEPVMKMSPIGVHIGKGVVRPTPHLRLLLLPFPVIYSILRTTKDALPWWISKRSGITTLFHAFLRSTTSEANKSDNIWSEWEDENEMVCFSHCSHDLTFWFLSIRSISIWTNNVWMKCTLHSKEARRVDKMRSNQENTIQTSSAVHSCGAAEKNDFDRRAVSLCDCDSEVCFDLFLPASWVKLGKSKEGLAFHGFVSSPLISECTMNISAETFWHIHGLL